MVAPWKVDLPRITYRESPNQSSRKGAAVRLVVLHDPEGGYVGTVRYICTSAAQVSYHVLVNESCTAATQLVRWGRKSWSVAAFNSVTDNIAIAGYAGNSWSYAALNRVARIIAFRLKRRGLPPVFCTGLDKNPDQRGFTFHSELGAPGGGHHDPGLTGAKKRFFIAAVKFQYRVGRFRPTWGIA